MNMLLDTVPVGQYTSGSQNVLGTVICDTFSDLPAATDFTGFVLVMGSVADIIDTGDRYKLDSNGVWMLQPKPSSITATVGLDLTGYYTAAQTDAAISNALVGGGTFYDRGEVLTADSANPIDFHSATFMKAGAWSFGGSNRPYISNLPASVPNTGGTIRSMFNQRTDRFFYILTLNSPSQLCFWYCQYTGAWQAWHKVQGTPDV